MIVSAWLLRFLVEIRLRRATGVPGLFRTAFRRGKPFREVAPLAFAENVRVHREYGPRIVAQVLRDLVRRRAQTKPVGRRVVTEGVTAEAQRELADDSYLELPSELVREQIVARILAGGVRSEDLESAR